MARALQHDQVRAQIFDPSFVKKGHFDYGHTWIPVPCPSAKACASKQPRYVKDWIGPEVRETRNGLAGLVKSVTLAKQARTLKGATTGAKVILMRGCAAANLCHWQRFRVAADVRRLT